MESLIDTLSRAVRGRVSTRPADLARVNRDGSHLHGCAWATVVPKDQRDVVAVITWARRHRVPLVARGGGTSLDGESVPLAGGIVVDLSGWDRLLEVRVDERWARVGPGMTNLALQESLAPLGLFFPPNPGSWATATVGGNVATNASGPRSFRYGPTRAWVRALDLVLGTGESVRWGSTVAKRSVGPDLVSVFVGSEGTLGVATEVTVRLAPRPEVREGLLVPLEPTARLGAIASGLSVARGTGLSAVEYLDGPSAEELANLDRFDRPRPGPLLLLEVEAGRPAEAARRVLRTRRALRGCGVRSRPQVFEDADALWTLRGRASVALDARVGERIREDVAVPLGQIDRLLRGIRRIADAERVPLYLFAHLGEGSWHPNFVVPPESAKAARVRSSLLSTALALGGTISGEHGIGAIKPRFLGRELGRPGVAVLAALKRACDPDGILNPGKLYPQEGGDGRSSRSPSGSAGGRRPGGGPSGARVPA